MQLGNVTLWFLAKWNQLGYAENRCPNISKDIQRTPRTLTSSWHPQHTGLSWLEGPIIWPPKKYQVLLQVKDLFKHPTQHGRFFMVSLTFFPGARKVAPCWSHWNLTLETSTPPGAGVSMYFLCRHTVYIIIIIIPLKYHIYIYIPNI